MIATITCFITALLLGTASLFIFESKKLKWPMRTARMLGGVAFFTAVGGTVDLMLFLEHPRRAIFIGLAVLLALVMLWFYYIQRRFDL